MAFFFAVLPLGLGGIVPLCCCFCLVLLLRPQRHAQAPTHAAHDETIGVCKLPLAQMALRFSS